MRNFLFLLLIFIFPIFSEIKVPNLQNALELYQKKNYSSSIRLLKKNKDFKSYYLLAHNYIALKNWNRAIFYLTKVWRLESSKREFVVLELVKCYFNLKQYYKSMEIIRNAKRDFPDNYEFSILEINNLIYLNKNKVALDKIENLKSKSNVTKDLLVLEALVYTKRAEYEKAELSLKWALSLEPSSAYILNNLASVYEKKARVFMKNKNFKESQKLLLLAKQNLESALKIKNYPNLDLIKVNHLKVINKLDNVSNKI